MIQRETIDHRDLRNHRRSIRERSGLLWPTIDTDAENVGPGIVTGRIETMPRGRNACWFAGSDNQTLLAKYAVVIEHGRGPVTGKRKQQ